MKAPYEANDVVVCVDASDNANGGPSPFRIGREYRVRTIQWIGGEAVQDPGFITSLVGISSNGRGGWRAERFRKIDDEVSEEFKELLRKLPAPKVMA